MVLHTEKKLPDHFYDDSEADNIYGFPVVLPNPTRLEKKEMEALSTFNRGVMLIIGKAGSGKDLLAMSTCYQNKRFWGRRILLDMKPRRLFGEYTYFDPMVMSKEIDKMARLASLTSDNPNEQVSSKEDGILKSATDEWIEEHTSLFEGSVLYLSELRRYCYNRNPHNRVNKAVGAICTQWRHLDMLIIGTHIQEHEIDRWTFKGNVTHWAECDWMVTQLNSTKAKIRRDIALTDYGNYNLRMRPIAITIDGGMPRRFLSMPDTVYGITPFGENALFKGRNDIEGIEILRYLKENKPQEAQIITSAFSETQEDIDNVLFSLVEQGFVKGNRFFDLWNSKNKVNLKPSIGGVH